MPASNPKPPVAYRFDDVVVERDNFRVLKSGQAKTLEPRAFDVLIFLLDHRGRVVEKQELFDRVWKETFVSDGALTRIVNQIRHAVGDDPASPRYIETVHKRGYRLIADVEDGGSTTLESIPEEHTLASLAILPFANLNADPDEDYFVDGMTDLLITDLSKIGALKVISRTSAMHYKNTSRPLPEIARELNVDAVIEGSVLHVGERVRITAQLISAATDQHLWAESYERELSDVLALQSEIAQTIAGEVRVVLTHVDRARLAKVHRVNPEAHLAYLKGRYFINKGSPDAAWKAIEYFQLAIEKDPHYAIAYAGLADGFGLLAMRGCVAPREVLPKLREAAVKAVQMDDTLSEAHAVMGKLRFYCDWDWPAAEHELKLAIELSPNDTLARLPYSYYLATTGRFDEATAEIKRAWELDPFSLPINVVVGWQFYVSGQYNRAIEQWQKTTEMEPDCSLPHWMLLRVFGLMTMYEEALAEACKAFSLLVNPDVLEALENGDAHSGFKGAMDRAAQTLAAQSEIGYVKPKDVALLFVHAGREDKAVEWLERAYAERHPALFSVGVEPDWQKLHRQSRFQALLQRVGLRAIIPANNN